jgi:sn-glycerol 3-phosphate transport system ATP-binding protein
MNILDLTSTSDGAVIAGGNRVVTKAAAGNLQFGIRPEHVMLSNRGEDAVVQSSEYFGADTILICRIGSQTLQVRVPGRPGLGEGEAVKLAWDVSAMHFFDTPTGKRRDDLKPN